MCTCLSRITPLIFAHNFAKVGFINLGVMLCVNMHVHLICMGNVIFLTCPPSKC